LQEPREADQIGSHGTDLLEDAPAEVVTRGTPVTLDHGSRYTGLSRSFEAKGVGAAGDDQHDFGTESVVGDAVKEIL
jgi:hypothetical protein